MGRAKGLDSDQRRQPEDATAGPDKDEPGSAGIGVLGQVMGQLLGEGSREGDGRGGHGVI